MALFDVNSTAWSPSLSALGNGTSSSFSYEGSPGSTVASDEPFEPPPTGSAMDFTTCLFFIFPVIGLVVLVMGSWILRKRQVQQDADAIQRYRDRVRAAQVEQKTKEERRTRMVEMALVTAKVTFLAEKMKLASLDAASKQSGAVIGRSATMESFHSDLDSSSGTVSRTMQEASVGAITDDINDAAERGQRLDGVTPNDRTSDCSPPGACDNEEMHFSKSCKDDTATLKKSDGGDTKQSAATVSLLDWQTDTCSICLEPYRENDSVSYSKHQNCNHAFHRSCIVSWLKDESHNDCPCCRQPYLQPCIAKDDVVSLGYEGSDNV